MFSYRGEKNCVFSKCGHLSTKKVKKYFKILFNLIGMPGLIYLSVTSPEDFSGMEIIKHDFLIY